MVAPKYLKKLLVLDLNHNWLQIVEQNSQPPKDLLLPFFNGTNVLRHTQVISMTDSNLCNTCIACAEKSTTNLLTLELVFKLHGTAEVIKTHSSSMSLWWEPTTTTYQGWYQAPALFSDNFLFGNPCRLVLIVSTYPRLPIVGLLYFCIISIISHSLCLVAKKHYDN